MILLDTNVVSEVMRGEPSPIVMAWMDAQATADLYVSTVTEAEIFVGVNALPDGRRRSRIRESATIVLMEYLGGRLSPFDRPAAHFYAEIVAARARGGRPMSPLNAIIAATAKAHGAVIATRNIKDFDGCGIGLVNRSTAVG